MVTGGRTIDGAKGVARRKYFERLKLSFSTVGNHSLKYGFDRFDG